MIHYSYSRFSIFISPLFWFESLVNWQAVPVLGFLLWCSWWIFDQVSMFVSDWIRWSKETSTLMSDSPVRLPALRTSDQGWIGWAALTHIVTIATLIYPDPDHGVQTHRALQDAGHLRRPREALLLQAGALLKLGWDTRRVSKESILWTICSLISQNSDLVSSVESSVNSWILRQTSILFLSLAKSLGVFPWLFFSLNNIISTN